MVPRLQIFFLLFLILIFFTAEHSFAAYHYVRSSATGTGSGADWINACTDFTGSCAVNNLVRGDTYYVATGTYAGRTFDTPTLGTLVITIKGATANDHGSDVGWLNTYGVDVAQAVWSYRSPSTIQIYNSYFVFDGSVGSLSTKPDSYGFLVKGPACPKTHKGLDLWGPGNSANSITVRHVAYTGCTSSGDLRIEALGVGCGDCHISGITIGDNFFANVTRVVDFSNVNGIVYERNVSQGQWSSAANHGETISFNNTNNWAEPGSATIRNNWFLDCAGTACIACGLLGEGDACNGLKVYGNVFRNKVDGGNGIIATGSSAWAYLRNVLVYNNTFIGNNSQLMWLCEGNCTNATGNEFKNNFIYASAALITSGTGSIISDSNYFYNTTSGAPFGANQQVKADGPCPFVSCSSNWHLLAPTMTGKTLSTPYSVDPEGLTRGANGVWMRGAYDRISNGNPPPRPPSHLKVF